MSRITRLSLIVAVSLFAAASVSAEEGRIPIFAPISLTSGGADFSGNYTVTRNVAASSPTSDVISIVGDCTQSVEIDLNGFELTGPSSSGRVIDVVGVNNFVLRNGSIRADSTAIFVDLSSCDGASVEIERVKVTGGTGSWVISPSVFLRHNTMTDIPSPGPNGALYVAVTGQVMKGVIEDNILRDIAGNGIYLGVARGFVIMRNHVQVSGKPITIAGQNFGIRVEENWLESSSTGADPSLNMPNSCGSCSVKNNQVFGGAGMYFKNMFSSRISGNAVYVDSEESNGYHFEDSSGNRIHDNVAYGYIYGAGILLDGDIQGSDENTLEGNLINAFQLGIHMTGASARNSYGRNSVRRNLGGGTCPGQVSACAAPGLCDEGFANVTFGDNLTPGPPPC